MGVTQRAATRCTAGGKLSAHTGIAPEPLSASSRAIAKVRRPEDMVTTSHS